MPVDGLVLYALLQEIEPRLRNGRVTKIFQPWANGILIRLRGMEGDVRLVLAADASLPACHITTLQPENPLQAPVFAMVLRKHLEPARLLRIEQMGLDRVVHFVFEVHEEGGGRGERILALELLGQRSNLILIDAASGTIIDALRRHKDPRSRDILPGVPYESPTPASALTDPLALDGDELLRRLRLAAAPMKLHKLLIDHCDGIGAFAAQQLLQQAGIDPEALRGDVDFDQLQTLVATVEQLFGAIQRAEISPAVFAGKHGPDFWLLPPVDAANATPFPSLNDAADHVFRYMVERRAFEKLSAELLRVLRRHHARSARKLQARRQEQRQAQNAEQLRHWGDLLMVNLYQIQPGATEAVVSDYAAEGAEVRIPLDRSLSPAANAQRYYQRYQKLKRAAAELERQVEMAEMELQYLEGLISSIELSEDLNALMEIRLEMERQGLIQSLTAQHKADSRRRRPMRSEPLKLRTSDGSIVWVGRNNRQNDYLTLRMANPNDIWLHTQKIPGSHVILRPPNGASEPSESALLEAAEAAAYYSQARNSRNVPVDFTLRKYVRKPSGAPPGFVIYDHHKTLYVTPSEEKIMRMQLAANEAVDDEQA